MAAWGVRRDPQAPRSVREKPRVSAGPVPSGKGDTRPIVLGLGRKTRDQTGPTRTRGSRERTPLPGRASGPRASPPRSRPSPVPLPHPYGRGKQATLLPKPHARKRLTRLRTSHFVPSTSAKGPQRLLSPPATRCRPAPPRPYRHLRAAPPSFGPAPPRLRSPLPSPPSTSRGREPSCRRHRLYLLLLMRTEGASNARASVRWLRRRPSSGCTQSGSAGPAAAAAARPGAALGLAVPRRSSRRGGRRGASVCWAGRHCRSPSG